MTRLDRVRARVGVRVRDRVHDRVWARVGDRVWARVLNSLALSTPNR